MPVDAPMLDNTISREECLKLAKKLMDLTAMPAACQPILAKDAATKMAWEGARPGMAARQSAQAGKMRPNHAQLQRRLTSHHARYGNK
mmetsp:Transcript_1968/g.5845  ORF Transcript_1968/g.5845 Transcript_1968/m.5845 type:complete len:88 (+) Transcript_1968:441-704(+)